MLVDRCRTNLFPNGARPVFRFLVRLLEKLEGEHGHVHQAHGYAHVQAHTHSYSSAGVDVRGSHSHANSARGASGSAASSAPGSELLGVFKALNRNILLLLGNNAYGSEPDLVLTFNALIRNQRIVFSPANNDHEFIFSLCYQLYKYLLADSKVLREPAIIVSFVYIKTIGMLF